MVKPFIEARSLNLKAQQTLKYWSMARSLPVPNGTMAWKKGDLNDPDEKTLNIYLDRFSDFSMHEADDMVLLAFNKNRTLMYLSGSESMIRDLKKGGIQRGTSWDLHDIGPNAVSVGFVEENPFFSVGVENYNLILQKYALYFAPVIVYDVNPPFRPVLTCGIAILVPAEKASRNYQAFAAATALHLISDFHHLARHYKRYNMTNCGVLTVDLLFKDRPLIRHADQPLFDILEIKEDKYQGRPLTDLIDAGPVNKKFWAILESGEEVHDLEIPLSVIGKKMDCIISTDSYDQPALEVVGMHFFITTSKWIAGTISRQIGNNATRGFDSIVGNSSPMKSAIARGKLIANTDSNIIILGESGTGKDVFAQAIHNSGSRKDGPFIAVNCGALSRDLIASELFGYEGGSFTGAKKQGNIGKFELANGGTLFLDEIGELPMDMQATLLRAVEQKKIMHIGGSKEIEVDVRIISATNADLPGMIEKKLFREDLYYRLSTFELCLPPLRDRGDDPVLLAEYFIQRACGKCGRMDVVSLLPETQELLKTLPWRGNVRELQNLIEGIVQLYPDNEITPDHIYANMRSISAPHIAQEFHVDTLVPERITRQGKKADISRLDIENALDECNQNRSEAAEKLGIARKTLYRYIKKYGIE